MSLTPSNMLPLGTAAPVFSLPNMLDNLNITPADYAKGKPFVVAFICNHCPFVVHIIDKFTEVANQYQQKGIAFITISANDVEHYPADAPELMKTLAQEKGFAFPYCYDETQAVAKAYDAACTPDFYLFDANHVLVYRGRFDDARPNSEAPVTGKDLIAAMDNVLSDKLVGQNQHPSMGCNIKWKK